MIARRLEAPALVATVLSRERRGERVHLRAGALEGGGGRGCGGSRPIAGHYWAQFLSADLHIHSYGGSHDVKDDTMTPKAIVDSAVRQGLGVIAITDHNSDTNVWKALDHALTAHGGDVLVLPGVEVTTAHGHLPAYFSPSNVSALSKFLSRLDLVGEKGGEDTRTQKSMADVIGEVDRLGGICIAAHIDRERTGFEAFAPGFQNWKKDILTSSGLYGLECDSSDALAWYSDGDTGVDGAERRKILEARRSVETLKSRRHLAHLHGSDSHSMAANGPIHRLGSRSA